MNCPKSVFVGGLCLKVVRADLSDEGSWGDYDHDRRTIRLDASLGGESLKETLRHEMLEAALMIGGPAWNEGSTCENTEAIVRCIECVFFPAWEKVCAKMP